LRTKSDLTPEVLRTVRQHQKQVYDRLRTMLREAPFSNRLLIAPRRLDEIAQNVAAAFLLFLESEDETAVAHDARNLAREGLGFRSIVMMTEALHRVCWDILYPEYEAIPALLDATGRYGVALLEAYMDEREKDLLKEQERTQQALYRAQNTHAEQQSQ
jgi:hypothetical protein